MNARCRARRYAVSILVCLLVALALASSPSQPGRAQTLLPRAYLPLVMRADPPDPIGYGVQAHATDATDFVMDLVNGLGFGWIKQQARWEHIELSDDGYVWHEIDRVVDAAHAKGLKVLLSVTAAPAWSRPGKPGEGPPDDPAKFAEFMSVMAAHYQGKVQAYEVWNEQNLQREWNGVPLSAAGYVTLLSGAYAAIKTADPNAIVVSGAPAPTGVNDGVIAIDDRVFVQQMYAAGLSAVCDAVGAHPYGFANPPEVYYTGGDLDPTRSWDDHPSFFFRNTLEDYYALMSANGDKDKKVWATEFGWPTVDGMGVPPSPGYEYAADIDEAQQASYIVGGYGWAAQWGHAGVLFLWNLNLWPITGDANNEMSKFSILRGDWSPRPAYIALQGMNKP